MSDTRVFNYSGAGYLPLEGKAMRSFTTIAFGDENPTIANFTMIDESRGTQASRLQVDATLDGKLHVVGTTTGVGTYSAVFYDGPICGEKSKESAIEKYLQLSSIKDRVATIYIYSSEETVGNSSKCSAKFSGILNSMATSMLDEGGAVYIKVALSITGSWNK